MPPPRPSSWPSGLRSDHPPGAPGGQPLRGSSACDVCSASVEKRIRMEQVRALWGSLLDSLSRFRDWLEGAEAAAPLPSSAHVLYAEARAQLKRCEGLQRQVGARLAELEALNGRYRRLVLGRGDGDRDRARGRLRALLQDSNRRWHLLHQRAAAGHKRLKHLVSRRELFDGEEEGARLGLAELALRLSDVEHFSGGSARQKVARLQSFRSDVQRVAKRVDAVLAAGEGLMQRSDPRDAVALEEALRALSGQCQTVFGRLAQLQGRLVSHSLVFEDSWLPEWDSEGEECGAGGGRGPPEELEWDPAGDVGGSTSPDDEDSSFHSGKSGPEADWVWASTTPSQWCGQTEPGAADPLPPGAPPGPTRAGTAALGRDCPLRPCPAQDEGSNPGGLCRAPAPFSSPAGAGPAVVQDRGPLGLGVETARVENWLRTTTGGRQRCSPPDTQAPKMQPSSSAPPEVALQIEMGSVAGPPSPPRRGRAGPGPGLLLLLLLLLGSLWLLLPPGRPDCTLHRPAWPPHLVLRYVNGPPPT
ncbi:nesprin-4 [Ornithorhynchus anatinus]|uniref:nesprin-4 n=1 Tax=Ornithorhynchus anatinus TaxID=9258 RepID=UPI0010A8B98F|nr:nesprin-4 [Ornithorhynchus anatinus]